MKKLFKVSLLAVALLVFGGASAQEKATTFGVRAGLNLSNLSGDGESADAKVGFNVGVTVEQALAEGFYLQTGLELTTKGAKESETVVDDDGNSIKATATMNAIYLQIPIHAAYKINVTEDTKVVFFAGPYLAYGVGGKITAKGESQGIEVKVNGGDFFGSDRAKSFDFGLGGGVGAEFGKIGVNLGYDFGLANIGRDGDKIRNRNA